MLIDLVPCPHPLACGVIYGHEAGSPAYRRCSSKAPLRGDPAAQYRPILTSKPEEVTEAAGVYITMARRENLVTYTFDHEEGGGFAQVTFRLSSPAEATPRPFEVWSRMLDRAASDSDESEARQCRGLMLEVYGSQEAIVEAKKYKDGLSANEVLRTLDVDALSGYVEESTQSETTIQLPRD